MTDIANIETIVLGFKDYKFDPLIDNHLKIPHTSGNYIICLRKNSTLPQVSITPVYTKYEGHQVIYTGVSSKSLRTRDYRQHFNGNNAGRSTIRKSLGVLFGYKQVARDRNILNGKTKFTEQDENRLSKWMSENLILYFLPTEEFGLIEFFLIQHFNPPLNLKDNFSQINLDFRKLVSALRKKGFS